MSKIQIVIDVETSEPIHPDAAQALAKAAAQAVQWGEVEDPDVADATAMIAGIDEVNARVEVLLPSPGKPYLLAEDPDHEHTWTLVEAGYIREWSTTFEDDGTIRAVFSGSDDFSDVGDGHYLECKGCQATRELTEEEEEGIDWA